MSMVEVDPKLFIKCRLCLEDSGTYQIVPTVRTQISYCFDINVEPFDGLPQLICKKCQSILSDYSKTKKSFIEKQDGLKLRVQENNLPKEVVKLEKPETTAKRENIDPVDKYESKSSKRWKVTVPSSANESECNRESILQLVNPTRKVKCKKQDWKKKYQKIFSCRLCSLHCYSMKAASHHSSNHRILKSKHKDVFKKYCVVELPKVDSKPNITGSIDQVVYSKNKIIAKGNPDYYIAYKYSSKKRIQSSDDEDMPAENLNATENSDSSLRSDDVVVRRRKRQRICSRSSNETVVLENKSDKSSRNSQENECINIDDTASDDEETDIQREKRKNTKKSVNIIKQSAVAKLINTTYNKFLKKHEQPDKPSLEQLNRKITSIGRQIINKRGFNCNRVMKYMDHLNLDIIWLSRTPLNVTSNSNYLKIIPRTRYANEKNINDFEGYKKKYDVLEIPSRTAESIEQKTSVEETSAVVEEISENQGIFSETVDTVSSSANETSRSSFAPLSESAMLYSVTAPNTKKLLNANPAANPRQLKKFTVGPKSFQDRARSTMLTLEVNPLELTSDVTSEHENNIQMPIITFTTSLAVPQAEIIPVIQETLNNNSTENGNPENSNNEISNNQNPKPTVPRIKVKSVTELMSQETLDRMNEPASVVKPNQQITQNGSVFEASQNNVPSISEDYVILHTVELPNTKTSSPFKYFRMLLQVHNLTLLDTDAFLTAEFHTLIRFKVLYKQELKDQPVVLCLSLFCSNNVFCLKIRDRNEDNINMTKISANWQWEILKIYTGEVVTKLLNNARKISPEVFENTNSFLCLLKSITFIPR